MTIRDEILALIEQQQALKPDKITDDLDLFDGWPNGAGIYGDDAEELLGALAKRFKIDMSGYLWYFHTGEEPGCNPGAIFFKRPNQRVQHIPVTLALLVEAAETKVWPVNYPPHTLPEHRWDLRMTWGCLLVLLLLFALASTVKLLVN